MNGFDLILSKYFAMPTRALAVGGIIGFMSLRLRYDDGSKSLMRYESRMRSWQRKL